MVRKLFLIAIAVLMVASWGMAEKNVVVPYVYKAAKPITVDCNLNEWNFCYPVDFNRSSIPDSSRAWGWIPATDTVCSGRLYMMYDDTYFYFAANVRDESPGHFSDAGWAATALEYYISNKNLTKTASSGDHLNFLDTLGVYDMQLNISFSARLDSIVINFYYLATGRTLKWNKNDIKYKLWDAGDGYVMEGRIPWDSLKSPKGVSAKFVAGTRVAATWSLFHMSANELSGDFKGYQFSKNPPWQGPTNWQVVDVFGSPDKTIWGTNGQFNFVKPYIRKVKKAPTIDCNLKEWNACWPIDFNRKSIPDSSRAWGWIPASDTVCSGRLYMMYDDTYFYFAANVRDESPGHFSDAGWAATALEYYLSNKNIPTALAGDHLNFLDTLGVYDMQLNISFSARLDSVVINFYYLATGKTLKWVRSNVKYKLWDAGDGYVMEGRIPWDSLKSPKGVAIKLVPGTHVAATWSLFHMSANELSGDFKGYQYSKNPPWQGPINWQTIDVMEQPLVEYNLPPTIELSVKQTDERIPAEFALSNAYPNPFNPSTVIQYSLAKAGMTSLRIYNLIGQEITTLVDNQYQSAGTYTANIDLSKHPSGVYFCALEQNNNRIVRKLMLLK